VSKSKETTIPDNLKAELAKYYENPKRYARQYSVCYKMLLPYINIKKKAD
jgi:hypothetical protein